MWVPAYSPSTTLRRRGRRISQARNLPWSEGYNDCGAVGGGQEQDSLARWRPARATRLNSKINSRDTSEQHSMILSPPSRYILLGIYSRHHIAMDSASGNPRPPGPPVSMPSPPSSQGPFRLAGSGTWAATSASPLRREPALRHSSAVSPAP